LLKSTSILKDKLNDDRRKTAWKKKHAKPGMLAAATFAARLSKGLPCTLELKFGPGVTPKTLAEFAKIKFAANLQIVRSANRVIDSSPSQLSECARKWW
jgi:hypothetical protein